jgi:hypothetical protein
LREEDKWSVLDNKVITTRICIANGKEFTAAWKQEWRGRTACKWSSLKMGYWEREKCNRKWRVCYVEFENVYMYML